MRSCSIKKAMLEKKWLVLCLALLVLAARPPGITAGGGSARTAGSTAVVDKIVAVVNGEPLLLSEIKTAAYIMNQSRLSGELEEKILKDRRFLKKMVTETLIYQEAVRAGFDTRDDEIDKLSSKVLKKNNIPFDQFLVQLGKMGLSYDEYREQLRREIIKAKIIRLEVDSKVTLSEEELKKAIEEAIERERENRRINIQQILILAPQNDSPAREEARKTAEEILKKLKNGQSFDELARKFSQGPAAKDGGILGWIRIKDLAPPLKDTLKDMKRGDISGVIPTQVGFHIIRVLERKEIGKKERDAIADKVRSAMYQKAAEKRYESWVKSLWDRAQVKYLIEQ